MTDNVVHFTGVTRLDLPAERILDGAQESDLDQVIVIGWDKNGDFYFASSMAAGPENLWLLELAKKGLLKIGDPDGAG